MNPNSIYIGQILLFGGNFAPRNCAFCEGQLLPIADYDALFAILGTMYGGDGRSTFALPKMENPSDGGKFLIAISGNFPPRS